MVLTRMITAMIVLTLTAGVAQAQSDSAALSPLQKAVACAPPASFAGAPASAPRIIGGQEDVPWTVYGAGNLVLVSGGTGASLELGQRYFVRRPMAFARGPHGNLPFSQTLGWIRLVSVNPASAVAIVEASCESLGPGDYLEPFAVPAVPTGADRLDTTGAPDFSSPAQIIFGSDRQRTGGAGDFMLIDRGSSDGIMSGARLAVYRDIKVTNQPLAAIGEAIVISTAETTALIRILASQTAVETGDYVVPRKP